MTSIHDKAIITAEATEAAGVQGKFWQMQGLLYERQAEWAGLTAQQMPEILGRYAEELGLDVEEFSKAIEEGTYRDHVQADYDEAVGLGLGGTPTLFINGQLYQGPREDFYLIGFLKMLNYDGLTYDSPPPMIIDPEEPYFATFVTSKGSFCVELYADRAPQTVNNFVFLAQEGFYDGISFHRVLPGFVAQTGDPTGGGFGGPGYTFADEFHPELTHDGPGVLSMANAGENSNGSQFFITYRAVPELDGKHSVFGRVVEGMDVAESLAPRDPQQDPYSEADTLISIEIGSACE